MPLASLSRRGAPAAALVALSIGLAACSSSGTTPANSSSSTSSAPFVIANTSSVQKLDPQIATNFLDLQALGLSHAEQRLREQGSDTVSLHVFEANERARRLYAKAGYTPDGSTRVEPEYEATEVRLVKALS